ncbi:MAG: hypothetical protein JWN78_1819, partial [Bacteroidota bacterium]|nr:hypothetical protein [Bacteroidota bacterium]
ERITVLEIIKQKKTEIAEKHALHFEEIKSVKKHFNFKL